MVAKEHLFDVKQFSEAISAGVAAGAVGSAASPAGDALTLELRNVLRGKYEAAAAAGNITDLLRIADAALTLGDNELAAQAIHWAATQ